MHTKFEENSANWKNVILENRGLKNGMTVRFQVENQSCYLGKNEGRLKIVKNKHPYIVTANSTIEINEYLGAYINTIREIR